MGLSRSDLGFLRFAGWIFAFLFCGFSFAFLLGSFFRFFFGLAFRTVGSSIELQFCVFVTGEAPVIFITNNAFSCMVNRMQRATYHAFLLDHDALSTGLNRGLGVSS